MHLGITNHAVSCLDHIQLTSIGLDFTCTVPALRYMGDWVDILPSTVEASSRGLEGYKAGVPTSANESLSHSLLKQFQHTREFSLS